MTAQAYAIIAMWFAVHHDSFCSSCALDGYTRGLHGVGQSYRLQPGTGESIWLDIALVDARNLFELGRISGVPVMAVASPLLDRIAGHVRARQGVLIDLTVRGK